MRELTLVDYEAIYALWSATEGIGLGDSDSREAIGVFLQRNPGLSQVAQSPSGALVGTVPCGHDGRRGYQRHLVVAPSHRSHGLGRARVDAYPRLRRDQNIAKCNIFHFADKADGRSF